MLILLLKFGVRDPSHDIDMTAGKLIHSISDISGAINSLTFHPTEFLMAVTSTDCFIKVFDLQSFECISTSHKINNPK